MNSTLYVRNFSNLTTEEELRNLFFQAGNVTSIELIKDRHSGYSKGYAFIEMSNQSEAQQAVFMFNGRILADHELHVNLMHQRGDLNGLRGSGTGYLRRYPQKESEKRF